MVKQPTVTVIIPNYNNAAVIRRAIDSVLAQSFSDFELLVVDDASTDESLAVIRTYDDPRLRLLVNEENVGVAGVWNRAVREARGEWVALLDSDDSWQPEKLSRQMAFLREHPGLAGCTCGYRHVCLDGTQIVIPTERDTHIRQVLFHNILHTGTTMVARGKCLQRSGGLMKPCGAARIPIFWCACWPGSAWRWYRRFWRVSISIRSALRIRWRNHAP
jgi:glycosyltransferase involved in cell wall biosynthesis